MKVPEDADRDFTAGALVVDDGELLLIDHGKYSLWLQPGGHVEKGETPDTAARRETREETGIEIEIIDSFEPDMNPEKTGKVSERQNLPRPFNVNLHEVEPGHYHCDFVYLAKVKNEGEATHGHEHNGMEWFSIDELEALENIPDDTKEAGLKALEMADQF